MLCDASVEREIELSQRIYKKCSRKRRYRSRKTANACAREINKDMKIMKCESYKCKYCGYYHVGRPFDNQEGAE